MSEEQLKAFLDAVKADKSLQNKLKEAIDPDDVLAVAREAGFAVSAEELKKAQAEIADNELEGVAGGFLSPANWLAGNVNRTNNQVVVDGRLLPSTPC
jgi:predicted ribosomally synthesized peptide with nif11-like leader